MNVLLLCAGFGTRLRPLTLETPKCLLPIAGRPLIDYWLDTLFASKKVERVLVNVHYKAEQFIEHIRKSPYRDRVTIVREPEILGTAGSLIKNKSFFKNDPDLLLIHGDNFYTGSIDELIDAHTSRPPACLMTMLLFEAQNPEHCGIVICDKSGVVTAFYEKQIAPPGNLANAAIYALSSQLACALEETVSDFSLEVIPFLLNKIYTVKTAGNVIDIGIPESYKYVNNNFEDLTVDNLTLTP